MQMGNCMDPRTKPWAEREEPDAWNQNQEPGKEIEKEEPG